MSAAIERTLSSLLTAHRAPPGLSRPWRQLADFARRPGKRLRPRLVLIGWHAAGRRGVPRGVQRFAAGMELLHAFFLVHDDIADGADTRRGGPALHRLLGAGRLGENLAVVAGDLLFVEAVDAMLCCDLPGMHAALREVLSVCRDTAAGQWMDLAFAEAPPERVGPAAARRAELLKTARYSFEAPLAAGALLGGAPPRVVRALREVARPLGLAFQLQDDLIPFRAGDAAGKPAAADLCGGKKTWLFALAWRALDELGRARLRAAMRRGDVRESARLLKRCGALGRVEREVARLSARSRAAAEQRALRPVRDDLRAVIACVEEAR